MHYYRCCWETSKAGFQDAFARDPAAHTTTISRLLCDFKQHNLFQTCMNPTTGLNNNVHTQKHSMLLTILCHLIMRGTFPFLKESIFLNLMCLSFVLQRQIKEVSSILSKFPSKSNVAHEGGYVSLLHEAHGLCPSQHETPWLQIWEKEWSVSII